MFRELVGGASVCRLALHGVEGEANTRQNSFITTFTSYSLHIDNRGRAINTWNSWVGSAMPAVWISFTTH